MSSNDYHFITQWRVKSAPEEVSEILGNVSDLARWWPSVYLDVQELELGDEQGIGKVVNLAARLKTAASTQGQKRLNIFCDIVNNQD